MKLATEHVYTLLIAAVAATLVLTLPSEPSVAAPGATAAPRTAAANKAQTRIQPAHSGASGQNATAELAAATNAKLLAHTSP